jgi:hypothetical protein
MTKSRVFLSHRRVVEMQVALRDEAQGHEEACRTDAPA